MEFSSIRLRVEYIYPQIIEEFGIQGGLVPEDVEQVLKTDHDIQAVLVVSPTYDGIVSDVEKIVEICHGCGIPLIVDEAHGAHFRYHKGFPVSALDLGADVVIQSLHKTLPAFTQTSILHVKGIWWTGSGWSIICRSFRAAVRRICLWRGWSGA